MLKTIILLCLSLSLGLAIGGCSSRPVDVKSPCVSAEGGPCGHRKNVNEQWMKESYGKNNA